MNKSYRLQISCYSRPMNDKKLAPVPRFQGTPGSIRTVGGQSEEDSGERGLAPVVQTLDSAIQRISIMEAPTTTPKAMARADSSCYLATSSKKESKKTFHFSRNAIHVVFSLKIGFE